MAASTLKMNRQYIGKHRMRRLYESKDVGSVIEKGVILIKV